MAPSLTKDSVPPGTPGSEQTFFRRDGGFTVFYKVKELMGSVR
ncbi:hypothetical protein AB0I77_34830 [Streptomyces sp. NPDC050619]